MLRHLVRVLCLVLHSQKWGIELWDDDFSIISYPSSWLQAQEANCLQ